MRLSTATVLIPVLALLVLPGSASAQFVPPDEGTGYAPPPPPPTAPTPTAKPSAPAGDRPLSYSERMKLKQEQERKAREAKKKASRSAVATDGSAVKQNRPTDFSIGVGAGWLWSAWSLRMGGPVGGTADPNNAGPAAGVGTDIFTPNTASARIRFGEDLAIEPGVLLGIGTTTQAVDLSNGSSNDTIDRSGGNAALINLAVRYGFMHRASSSAILIFGADFGFASVTSDPEGGNNVTQALALWANLNFGIGAEWFITPNLSFSGDVTSPLLSVGSMQARDTNSNPEVVVKSSTFDVGLNFAPGARLMFHVYY